MLTLTVFLVLAALVTTLASAAWKVPLWVPVFLLVMLEALRIFPVR